MDEAELLVRLPASIPILGDVEGAGEPFAMAEAAASRPSFVGGIEAGPLHGG